MLRPIQTGTQIFHFSRVFRHYIKTGLPKYADIFNQQWSDIPYQHIVMSLKPRDWQALNVLAKRWRILSCGFNMNHIIPIKNEESTVGGAVKADISFNAFPYLECYIDKGYQLPIVPLYTSTELPNKNGAQNSGDQDSAKLTMININSSDTLFNKKEMENIYHKNYNATAGANVPIMDLMNSSEWGTIQSTQEFSFEWSANQEDLVWRHGLTPDQYTINPPDSYQEANPYGRWDGAISDTASTLKGGPNTLTRDSLKRNLTKPAPSALVRPVTLHDEGGNLIPIVFQVLIKYHATIEVDVNDIGFRPIFHRSYLGTGDWPKDGGHHIFGKAQNTSGVGEWHQWTGANNQGKFVTGPAAYGTVV